MEFKGVWRDYQARVLVDMDGHLDDGRVHIVAAPGSGKTVLGLELMRRIGRATLILAPSLTIRNQWRERLFPLFLDDPHGWDAHISTEIDAPATMTIATCQALHAVHGQGTDRFEAVIARLNARGPVTLIVDEAHHLRREWWSALVALRKRLDDAVLVALTATPPYDAPFAEWSRYEDLCGPIDSEISVPELVRNGDLCAHQDHVLLSRPRHDELELLVARRGAIETMTAGMIADPDLIDCVAAHPWLTEPDAHEGELLDRPEYLTAMMILIHAGGRTIPPAATDLLGIDGAALPALTSTWLERLFQGLIDEPRSKAALGTERWTALRGALDGLGLIENGRVTLAETRAIFATTVGSIAKLDSIVEIARAEEESLGDGLRLVILSDRVRASELPRRQDAPFTPVKLGVVPIFETLRRAGIGPDALAVLTGTLVILPATTVDTLAIAAKAERIDPATLRHRPIAACPGHVIVEAGGATAQRLVGLVTRLFQDGAIRVLVGTQALLGEGWDAPAINSLILASNAGSYMSSNQMRGRAIRIDPVRPGKVAAIWHLATVIPGADAQTGDMTLLARRFDAFEGIGNSDGMMIENGIDRLGIDPATPPEEENARTLARARDRTAIAEKWRRSLGGATERSHVRRVAEANYAPRALAWRDTLQALVLSGIGGGALSAAGAVRHLAGAGTLTTMLMALCGATFLYSLPGLSRAAMLWWRNGTLERSLHQVAMALIAGLHHAGALARDQTGYTILVVPAVTGRYEIILDGASRAEERAFLGALAEVLGPVQNPRYLLVRESHLWGRRRADYHAVPSLLGARKDTADHFHRLWERHVGGSALIYTRTQAGRRVLLRARVNSFAAGMQRVFQRRSVWM
ncbi:DEAD/DEAH box helicase family protein [Sphingomonas sp.]|uniref:DEAD/DEAH box helicase family protein n=1 Tax=Sphingomonas sp. TaxID=28214 RepID=UPI002DD62778|nr:DEAD/DEAH box helicase family protein [Sphingomonas sp.]